MAERFCRLAIRWRWAVIVAAVAFVVGGGAWGGGVIGELSPGFTDPGSESARAAERIDTEVGRHQSDVLVLYSSRDATVDDASFRDPVLAKVRELRSRPEVIRVRSFYDSRTPTPASNDRHAQYVSLTLRGDGIDARAADYQRIENDLAVPGLGTRVGGPEAIIDAVNEHADGDLARAQAVTMPLLLLLLLVVFGSVVAALTPLVIGILAICGAFAAARLITMFTEVSIFTVNIVTILGLGLAINYALLVVSRFREQLATGAPPHEALTDTMRTAGRTVAVSGLTVALALSGLLLFPQPFLRSMGYGGIAAALVAALATLTVLPALLAVLGERIDAWRVPVPRRHRESDGGSGLWARLAGSVTRRPVRYVLISVAFLALLAAPAAGVAFGGADERVLPAGTEARVVAEHIRSDFPGGDPETMNVLVSGADPAATAAYTERVRQVEGVTAAAPVARNDRSTLLQVDYTGESISQEARDVVRSVRDLSPPAGAEVLLGGASAELVDMLDDMGAVLPWMLLLMAGVTFVVLLVAFRSVPLAVQTVVLNVLSAGASAGVVTWIFQDGHLSGPLDFTPTGTLDAMRPVLLLAVVFGLSTDYQLFLLSRVREEWLRTGDNTTAVTVGLRRTGRIITSAALLLMVVISGFSANSVSVVKIIGVGLLVAVLVDAFVVRVLLVPATMRLVGRANWWPGPGGSRRPPDGG